MGYTDLLLFSFSVSSILKHFKVLDKLPPFPLRKNKQNKQTNKQTNKTKKTLEAMSNGETIALRMSVT